MYFKFVLHTILCAPRGVKFLCYKISYRVTRQWDKGCRQRHPSGSQKPRDRSELSGEL